MSLRVSGFLYSFMKMYWRVRKPLTLGSRAILLREGRVRLVRLTYVNGWYLPGGGVDKNESFEQGMARELREECGVEAGSMKLFGLYHATKQGKSDHVAIFVVDNFAEIPGAKADPEIAEQKEFPMDQLPEGTTPATRRRLEEYRRGVAGGGVW